MLASTLPDIAFIHFHSALALAEEKEEDEEVNRKVFDAYARAYVHMSVLIRVCLSRVLIVPTLLGYEIDSTLNYVKSWPALNSLSLITVVESRALERRAL